MRVMDRIRRLCRIYVRRLLDCDYALVVAPDRDSIRVHGFAGADGANDGLPPVEQLISRLRDWGPVVVDDARLIAVPVSVGDHVMGVLIVIRPNPAHLPQDPREAHLVRSCGVGHHYLRLIGSKLGNADDERGRTVARFSLDNDR